MIKFVSDLRQVGGFSSTNKTDRHDITEILLKVALNTINQTYKHNIVVQESKTTAIITVWHTKHNIFLMLLYFDKKKKKNMLMHS